MSDAPSSATPVAIGAVMVGGTVAQVMSSDVAGFAEGDRVQTFGGWQDSALSGGTGVIAMVSRTTTRLSRRVCRAWQPVRA